MELLVATRNPGKARELAGLVPDAQAKTLADFDDDRFEPIEDGRTFRDNACRKAAGYARHFGLQTLADDSGLAVDALGGAPGIFSARFAEMHGAGSGDADNNALLLRQLRNVPDDRRTARFVCVLAIALPDGRFVATAEGDVRGTILREPRGTNGFGYDPLFLVPHLGKTTAELPPDEKAAISHRGTAGRRLRGLLERHPLLSTHAS